VEQFRERFFAKFRKPPRVHDWMAEICPRWVAARGFRAVHGGRRDTLSRLQ
jgi:hypothetical protein